MDNRRGSNLNRGVALCVLCERNALKLPFN